ncbi:MAG: hypothetical protein QOJ71_193 [Actinomycetota bacterium]|nr:hypothetical protein [Actinomycetota bacterium]
MNVAEVKRIERAPALRRGIEVWYAAFGGIAAWTVHLLFVASFEHWTFLHSEYGWTLHAATVVCTFATVAAMLLAHRLLIIAAGSDPASNDDAGQLLFLAQLGLLVGAINLALILLEGSYVLFIPRG